MQNGDKNDDLPLFSQIPGRGLEDPVGKDQEVEIATDAPLDAQNEGEEPEGLSDEGDDPHNHPDQQDFFYIDETAASSAADEADVDPSDLNTTKTEATVSSHEEDDLITQYRAARDIEQTDTKQDTPEEEAPQAATDPTPDPDETPEISHPNETPEQYQEKARIGAARAATSAISTLVSNPRAAGTSVMSGEFQQSGSGAAGTLFRAMDKLLEEDRVEIWGEFISMTAKLWDSEQADASLSLMETANLKLDVPEMFQARVKQSIGQAQDMILARRVEAMFSEGNDEGAEKLASRLNSKEGDDYKDFLRVRTKSRKRLRMFAFGAAGLAISILGIMTISGVRQVVYLAQNPPGFDLPEAPDFTPLKDMASQVRITTSEPSIQIEGQPSVEDIFNTPTTVEEPGQQQPPPLDISSMEDTGLQNSETQEPSQDDVEAPIDGQPDLPTAQIEQISPEVAYASEIRNCAIGQLVADAAIDVVLTTRDVTGARKADAFSKKVGVACDQIPVSEDVLEAAKRDITGVDIDMMAANIISQ
jgi:hypothetical protein